MRHDYSLPDANKEFQSHGDIIIIIGIIIIIIIIIIVIIIITTLVSFYIYLYLFIFLFISPILVYALIILLFFYDVLWRNTDSLVCSKINLCWVTLAFCK